MLPLLLPQLTHQWYTSWPLLAAVLGLDTSKTAKVHLTYGVSTHGKQPHTCLNYQ